MEGRRGVGTTPRIDQGRTLDKLAHPFAATSATSLSSFIVKPSAPEGFHPGLRIGAKCGKFFPLVTLMSEAKTRITWRSLTGEAVRPQCRPLFGLYLCKHRTAVMGLHMQGACRLRAGVQRLERAGMLTFWPGRLSGAKLHL